MGNAKGRRKAYRDLLKGPMTKEHVMAVQDYKSDYRYGNMPLPQPGDDCMRATPNSDLGTNDPYLMLNLSLETFTTRKARALRATPMFRCRDCNMPMPANIGKTNWTKQFRLHRQECDYWTSRREKIRQGWIPVRFLKAWKAEAPAARAFMNAVGSAQVFTETHAGRLGVTLHPDSWVRVWAVNIAWEVWKGAGQEKITLDETVKRVKAHLSVWYQTLGREDPPEEMRRLEPIYTLISRDAGPEDSFWQEEWFRAWQDLPEKGSTAGV